MEVDEDGFQVAKGGKNASRLKRKQLQAKINNADIMSEKQVNKLREMIGLGEVDIAKTLHVEDRYIIVILLLLLLLLFYCYRENHQTPH